MNTATFVHLDLTWAGHMLDEWPLIFLDSIQFVLCLISEKSSSVHDAETTRVSDISFILGVIWCLCSILQDVRPFQSRLKTVLELSANSTIAQNGSHKETEVQLGSHSTLGSEPGPKSQ